MSALTSLKEGSVIADGWAMSNGVSSFWHIVVFSQQLSWLL